MKFSHHLAAAALSALFAASAVAQSGAPSTSANRPAATAPSTATQSRGATTSQQQGGLVDINSASDEELDKLPGVGPARAQAIIANRPYRGKDELAGRKVLPQNVYDQIKDKIIARQGSTKESAGSSRSSLRNAKPR